MATLVVGTLLGDRYEIIRSIKAGGMGAVYEARDRRLADSRCAIKQLLEDDADDESLAILRRKFDEEMQFLASLNHPGIPRLRDFFSHERRQYLVMDLVEGDTLEQELDNAQATGMTLPVMQVVDDGIAVLDILAYLHSRKPPVVHRDVKPGNIIREVGGHIKLLDFGIARLHSAGQTTHTQLGTLCYAPLEQIQGHAEPRSDVYGLGATMHHLIGGVESPALAVPPLQRVAPDVDPDLAAIINRSVEPRPMDRFDSAAEMRDALIEWRRAHGGAPRQTSMRPHSSIGSGAPTSPSPRGPSTTAVRPVQQEEQARFPMALALAAVAVVAVLMLALFWRRPETTASDQPGGSAVKLAPTASATAANATPEPAPAQASNPPPQPKPKPPAKQTHPVAAKPASKPRPVQTVVVRAPTYATPVQVAPTPAPYVAPARTPQQQVAVAPTPAPLPPQTAPAPPQPQTQSAPPGPAGGPPGGFPPGGEPPGGPIERFQPPTPSGWTLVSNQSQAHPPRMDVTYKTSFGTNARLIVTDMPAQDFQSGMAASRLVGELGREGWQQAGNMATLASGTYSIPLKSSSGGTGAMVIRGEGFGGGQHVRVYAAVLFASSSSELQSLMGTAQQTLVR